MKATNWEFTNRALIFGLIFAISFPLYFLDPQNVVAALSSWLGPRIRINEDSVAQLLFASAACILIGAALLRTWASAYLEADVVYAPDLKTQSLVADGPYRHVRNPLYLANVLMAVAMGFMMSRVGFAVAVVSMVIFCYRLIVREEGELLGSQGERYERYLRAVPRLLPSLQARIASAGRKANWGAGFKAESWYWGFAAALAVFSVTLKLQVFFVILAASVILLWASPWIFRKKDSTQ
jgi:protein-S-isoprenylcysteine O-methyltransferase Ste14